MALCDVLQLEDGRHPGADLRPGIRRLPAADLCASAFGDCKQVVPGLRSAVEWLDTGSPTFSVQKFAYQVLLPALLPFSIIDESARRLAAWFRDIANVPLFKDKIMRALKVASSISPIFHHSGRTGPMAPWRGG